MRGVIIILATLSLIGTVINCDGGSLAADKVVESFYNAVNAGDTAKAQSYISPANTRMLDIAAAMAGCMAGKIQKVEILDMYEDQGTWGGPPFTYVFVRITCSPGVPTYADSNPGSSGLGKTCGDVTVVLAKHESGWRIHTVADYS